MCIQPSNEAFDTAARSRPPGCVRCGRCQLADRLNQEFSKPVRCQRAEQVRAEKRARAARLLSLA